MKSNLVKAWKTTILGSLIILAALVFLGMDKIDGSEFILVAGFGLGLMGTDLMKELKSKADAN